MNLFYKSMFASKFDSKTSISLVFIEQNSAEKNTMDYNGEFHNLVLGFVLCRKNKLL